MNIFSRDGGEAIAIEESVTRKSLQLVAAHKLGRKFLVLPVEDSRESVEWILASFQSPLAVVPINAAMPEAERQRTLQQLPIDSWIEPIDLPEPIGNSPSQKSLSEIWAVIFSSGSSGAPKGVALSGNALSESAAAHVKHSGRCSWLLNLPLFHVGGFSVVSRGYFTGTDIFLTHKKATALEIFTSLTSSRVEGISVVPTILTRLLEATSGFPPPPSLRVALVGGAPAKKELLNQASAAGWPVRATYGLTENSSQAATEQSAGGGLRPLPGVEIKVRTDGEILVRSPFLACGYFMEGELRPLPLEGGFFATGDLGNFQDGELTVLGRKSEMIISGGVKIFPVEVEMAMQNFPGLADCAAAGLPDAEWGEVVCLGVVGPNLDPDSVKSYLAKQLDPRKIPKHLLSLPAIPRSATGKVLRDELRALLSAHLLR